jgi:outer membrane protein
MKKTLLSLLIGLGVSSSVMADDLYQVYQQAQQMDPTVNRAKASRDAALEGVSISRAALLPQISGSIGYSDNSTESANFQDSGIVIIERDTQNLNLGLRLTQSIYDHSNWLNKSRAEQVATQSDANYAVSKQELIVRTVRAYLAILRDKDDLEFVRAEKRAIERQLEQTKQRFEVGLTAITDVHEAQANFDNTVAQEIQAENDVELSLEEMREITGEYYNEIAVLNTEYFDTPRPVPDKVVGWLDIAEEKSLDLMTRKIARNIAKKDIDLARSGHYPTLSLTASAGRDDTDITILNTESNLPKTDSTSISLNLSVPIYSGGRTSSQTDQARFNYVAASEDLELTHRSTVRSVRSSFNNVRAVISAIRAFAQAVVSSESALKATEAGFDVGTRTIVDVLDSTRNLYNAKRNLSGSRYDYIQSIVSLKRAAGNLTEQDVVDINRGLTTKVK